MRPSAARPFVVVAGGIATGKSSLVANLAAELGVAAHHERPRENPWFATPEQHAQQAETWFLVQSAAAHLAIAASGGGVLERALDEHLDVFSVARHRQGWLDDEQLGFLRRLRDSLAALLQAPDLLVLLDVDRATALRRIAARGRAEEQALPARYLDGLEERYRDFVASWDRCPVMRVDAARVDVRDPLVTQQLVSSIKEHIA